MVIVYYPVSCSLWRYEWSLNVVLKAFYYNPLISFVWNLSSNYSHQETQKSFNELLKSLYISSSLYKWIPNYSVRLRRFLYRNRFWLCISRYIKINCKCNRCDWNWCFRFFNFSCSFTMSPIADLWHSFRKNSTTVSGTVLVLYSVLLSQNSVYVLWLLWRTKRMLSWVRWINGDIIIDHRSVSFMFDINHQNKIKNEKCLATITK